MTRKPSRPPAAVRLSDPSVLVEDPAAPQATGSRTTPPTTPRVKARTVVTPEADDTFTVETGGALVEIATPPVRRRGFGWGKLFFGALSGLVTFAIGIWITDFVTSLFVRDDILGWIALGLAALTALGLVAVIAREVAGLLRLSRVPHLRAAAAEAAADGFFGKMAIHPAQVPIINDAFTPSAEALAEAQHIVAAFAADPDAGVPLSTSPTPRHTHKPLIPLYTHKTKQYIHYNQTTHK